MNGITIFTPTYNREQTIHRVYESLKAQSNKNFEWIIVDDGSTDDTEQKVLNWKKENSDFPITYLKKNNGGKISAIYEGVKMANKNLFLIADSDDRFDINTVDFFIKEFDKIPKEYLDNISGISCLCRDSETKKVVGNYYPESPLISNTIDIAYKYKVHGEKWGVLRTKVMKEFFVYKNAVNVKFLSESYFWYQISKQYSTIFYNVVLRTYYRNSTDSLSTPNTTKRHPEGVFLSEEMILMTTVEYFWNDILKNFQRILRLCYAGNRAELGIKRALQRKKLVLKLFITILWIPGKIINFLKK